MTTRKRIEQMLTTPIQRGKPLELSTETPIVADTGDSAKTHHRTIAPSEQIKRVNRGYKLREDLIKACKQRALDTNRMLYEVMEAALTDYLEEQKQEPVEDARIVALEAEVLHLNERLKVEERFRTDTEVRHFKKWLRSHDQPQDSDFAKRFMADTRLPQHASRALYEARLRACEYSAEDIRLFQDAWKTMLFTTEPDSQPRLKGYLNE
jgi:hypothetical protein